MVSIDRTRPNSVSTLPVAPASRRRGVMSEQPPADQSVQFWTEERTALCRELWAKGESASNIAKIIGAISRNSVLSKINRSGWSGPNSHVHMPRFNDGGHTVRKIKRKRRAPSRNNYAAVVDKVRAAKLATPVSLPQPSEIATTSFSITGPKSFLELKTSDCRWPLGDPGTDEFAFCAAERSTAMFSDTVASPYCPQHHAIAFEPRRQRRKPSTWRPPHSTGA